MVVLAGFPVYFGSENSGALKVGNQADFIVIDMNKAHLQPVFDYLANVIYSAQASDICLSVVDGEIIYKDGELTKIDEEKVIYESNKSKDRILSEI